MKVSETPLATGLSPSNIVTMSFSLIVPSHRTVSGTGDVSLGPYPGPRIVSVVKKDMTAVGPVREICKQYTKKRNS